MGATITSCRSLVHNQPTSNLEEGWELVVVAAPATKDPTIRLVRLA